MAESDARERPLSEDIETVERKLRDLLAVVEQIKDRHLSDEMDRRGSPEV